MLPRAHRLCRSAEFATVVRRGSRAATSTLVLHSLPRADDEPVRVGFVVSRAIGNAATRNLVKRRLRHLMANRLTSLGPARSIVVRANRAAATATFEDLGRDVDGALSLATRRSTR